jgi:hypothetical protein
MTTLDQTLCPGCGSPFEPRPISLPAAGGRTLETISKLCPSCERSESISLAAMMSSSRRVKPIEAPRDGGIITVPCVVCRNPFETESLIFPGDRDVKAATSHATVCDACAAKEKRDAPVSAVLDPAAKLQAQWVAMVGTRYENFHRPKLPPIIRPLAKEVLAWTPKAQGIGLLGPSGTGKSPLLYGLAKQLFLGGCDVFCTSGIEFQRMVHRAIEERVAWARYVKRCESAEVLLIDDADKLNFTPGVEAEYYGMLEHRRNWTRPLLCTLNMTGPELASMGRGDRSAAIVARLRDLCRFIPIEPSL